MLISLRTTGPRSLGLDLGVEPPQIKYCWFSPSPTPPRRFLNSLLLISTYNLFFSIIICQKYGYQRVPFFCSQVSSIEGTKKYQVKHHTHINLFCVLFSFVKNKGSEPLGWFQFTARNLVSLGKPGFWLMNWKGVQPAGPTLSNSFIFLSNLFATLFLQSLPGISFWNQISKRNLWLNFIVVYKVLPSFKLRYRQQLIKLITIIIIIIFIIIIIITLHEVPFSFLQRILRVLRHYEWQKKNKTNKYSY